MGGLVLLGWGLIQQAGMRRGLASDSLEEKKAGLPRAC